MAATAIRLFYEASTVSRALNAVAAVGIPWDELNLITHQERLDILEAMSGWAPRLVTVKGVGPILVIGPVAAALSRTAGEVAGKGLVHVLMDPGWLDRWGSTCRERMHPGGALVPVDTGEARAEQAEEVLEGVYCGTRTL
jgi:hypothetical protein